MINSGGGRYRLKEVAGDILLTKAEALAQGVAPNDNFANGLALALRERWPGMYKDFRHNSQTSTPKGEGSGLGPESELLGS